MKKDWKKLIVEAERLPLGKELWIGDRYSIILHCIEKIEKLSIFDFQEKLFYKTVLKRVI